MNKANNRVAISHLKKVITVSVLKHCEEMPTALIAQ